MPMPIGGRTFCAVEWCSSLAVRRIWDGRRLEKRSGSRGRAVSPAAWRDVGRSVRIRGCMAGRLSTGHGASAKRTATVREAGCSASRELGGDPARIRHRPKQGACLRTERVEPGLASPRPMAGFLAGLTRLKAGFIIAPLSNGNIALILNMAKRAGLPLDAILGAEVVQAYKPSLEAYLRTAEVLAMEPEQIGLVAAQNGDLAAARKCGMRTVFIPRPTEHGPNQTTDSAGPTRTGTRLLATLAIWPRSWSSKSDALVITRRTSRHALQCALVATRRRRCGRPRANPAGREGRENPSNRL